MTAATNHCADKLAFLDWAAGHPDLTRTDQHVLSFIVRRLVGRDRATPYRGWATVGLMADQCCLGWRTVHRALTRLEQLGLIMRATARGRGGRTVIDLPLAEGAAKHLQAKPFAKAKASAWVEANPSKICQQRQINDVENMPSVTDLAVENMPSVTDLAVENMSPVTDDSPYWLAIPSRTATPLKGSAAADAAARPDLKNGEGGGRGLRQDRGGPITTLATERLLKRLKALATKGKLQLDWSAFAAEIGEDRFRRWLRLQREERDPQLVSEALEAIATWTGCDPVELGAAVGTAKPKVRRGQRFPQYDGPPAYPDKITRIAIPPDQMQASAARLAERMRMSR